MGGSGFDRLGVTAPTASVKRNTDHRHPGLDPGSRFFRTQPVEQTARIRGRRARRGAFLNTAPMPDRHEKTAGPRVKPGVTRASA